MGEAVKAINAFLQDYSGIITSLLVILVFIGSLSKKFKNWIFRDIYSRLDKMENNDLRHIDLSLQRSRKIEDLTLDILTGVIPKGDVPNSRAQIETWYAREIEKLLKAQSELK